MRKNIFKVVSRLMLVLPMLFPTLQLHAEDRHPQSRVAPVYPPLAQKMRVSGTVKVSCTVNAQGKVTAAKAVSGHPLLVPAAEAAVKQWKFEPGDSDSQTTVDVVFQVN